MILVLAGTQDGRELTGLLAKEGYPVMISVVTEYARELIAEQVPVNAAPLDQEGLVRLIRQREVSLVIDASHPYAVNASENAQKASEQVGICYVRYERPLAPLPSYERLYAVDDYIQAAETAAALGKTIFLTTGSRHLADFKGSPHLTGHRLIARVLPDPEVLTQCRELGFPPKDIIAMQGPFTYELNIALFTAYQAEVIVTKNSGSIGGSDTKFAAAVAMELPLVVIGRPKARCHTMFDSVDGVIDFVRRNYQCSL
jgi:precorrin-6A/cobalt-precorrin-6A reductase